MLRLAGALDQPAVLTGKSVQPNADLDCLIQAHADSRKYMISPRIPLVLGNHSIREMRIDARLSSFDRELRLSDVHHLKVVENPQLIGFEVINRSYLRWLGRALEPCG